MKSIQDTADALRRLSRATADHVRACRALADGIPYSAERDPVRRKAFAARDRMSDLLRFVPDEAEAALTAARERFEQADAAGAIAAAAIRDAETARLRAEYRASQPIPGSFECEIMLASARGRL